MNYTSTRNSSVKVTAAEAISKGVLEDGGLFVPAQLPKLTETDLAEKPYRSYQETAFEVLKPYLDFPDEDLNNTVNNAYSRNFGTTGITRSVELDGSVYMLELWHGPTAAFKDMALQILPGLMSVSDKLIKKKEKTLILVATSGDTGKAALEGFKNAPDIEIAVFYPQDGVSETQKLQMTTQEGDNVHVFAVKGNFDDCQNAVKAVFTDKETNDKAAKSEVALSSANSINWGRLCPQIVYYVSAYSEMVRSKSIRYGDKINICVPTGNFGNILAAYYAMKMGIPVDKIICASNSNKILTDFINTGIYDCNRNFHATISPSMDILISSNLERLLYHLSGNSDAVINELFSSLKESGKFTVDKKMKTAVKSLFYGGWCSESDTKKTIKEVFNEYGYLMDPHTAVGYKVFRDYERESCGETGKIKTKTIIASTANPYKFPEAVWESLYGKSEMTSSVLNGGSDGNEADGVSEVNTVKSAAERLEEHTGICIPKSLSSIKDKEIRFTETLEKPEIKDAVLKILANL
jgi:threonine synthase